jgi:hypothetical protein
MEDPMTLKKLDKKELKTLKGGIALGCPKCPSRGTDFCKNRCTVTHPLQQTRQ